MHRSVQKSLLLALIFCFVLPCLALADMTVKFTNKTTKKVYLSLNYKDAVSGEWVTRGWWSAEPLSSKNFKLSTNNTIAYFYAHAGKSWWGGKKGQDGSISRAVVSDKFLVKDKNKPQGKNYRVVTFKKMQAKDGVFSVSLTGN